MTPLRKLMLDELERRNYVRSTAEAYIHASKEFAAYFRRPPERRRSPTLRHPCASHLVMAGVNLKTVKEILRHKSIEMTDRYAHLSPHNVKLAMIALESALKNEPKTDEKET